MDQVSEICGEEPLKAIVLSSGGVDSTTCLSIAVKDFGKDNVLSVSFFYGQKHDKELRCAERVADYYGVQHTVLNLSEIFAGSNCALLRHSSEGISHQSYAEQIKENGIVSTYVPFRNGLMLAAVASYAMGLYPEENVVLYLGAHADDAAGDAYADCSEEFINAIHAAIRLGTYRRVSIRAPFAGIDKAGVVKIGLELGTPYELTWSCYEGGEKPCGKCGTCLDRAAAFKANGVKDPAWID